MKGDPQRILDDWEDDDFIREFLDFSNTATTANMNQSRVASEILLSRIIAEQAKSMRENIIDQTGELTSAIREHADALVKSANAAEEHTIGLKRATWALFAATVVLAVAAVSSLV